MKKDLQSQFLILQSELDPHATGKKGFHPFDVGKQRNVSFWTVACTTSGMGDCALHPPRCPHASLEPVSSGNISQPVPAWDAGRPKQSRQVCWTTTSMACQVN